MVTLMRDAPVSLKMIRMCQPQVIAQEPQDKGKRK